MHRMARGAAAPSRADRRATLRRMLGVLVVGNLFGALLTYAYFRFVDYTAAQLPSQVSSWEIAFFIVGFTVLGVIGSVWGVRWTRPLVADDDAPSRHAVVRRRAILLPFAFAGLTLVGWVFAGLIWGLLFPVLAGTFSWPRSLRMVFGITWIAGTVATAFMFFASEHVWRRTLPAFFPEGDLSAVGGVLRLKVRTRLLVIFLMMSTVPLAILGVLAYTRAAALLRVDQATATEIVSNMFLFTAFIVAVGILAAIGLSVFVANSVAAPLRELQHAMRQVEQGNLEVRSTVVSNDEIGAAAEGFNRMVHGLRERELLKETFGKYVSPEVRDEILAGRVSLEGQVQELTILFADLRDFTPWVEATPPREVVRDLNAYFTAMDTAIRGQGGLVLQFIGDEIEAVFGAPVPRPDHAAMAARAALEMRARLARWNGERRRAGKAELHHGIGIHTGRVLAGNIGSSERLAYALVGDAVNLASRIQDLTKQFGADILVSGTTRRLLAGGFALEPLPAVRVKGKSDEVEVYRLA